MADFRQLFIVGVLATCCMAPSSFAAPKRATDIMSEALRQKASGNLEEAIANLEDAANQATASVQKNLARFMLGDCQLEAGKFADAAVTFADLLESVGSSEEKAEAIFRLMQAQSALGNKNKVTNLYSRMRKSHSKSPYFELARSFMNTEGLKESVEIDSLSAASSDKTTEIAKNKTLATPEKSEPADEDKTMTSVELPQTADTAAESPASPLQSNTTAAPDQSEPAVESAQAIQPKIKPEKTPDKKTATLLKEILTIEQAAGPEKDELVTKILSLQNTLKDGADKTGMDTVLLELAATTAKFGELLEACKTYDKILTHHPASPLVEKAYYEAIRLRAALGVHDAVIGWSKAFLAAFPSSKYRSNVRALVEYSQADGKLDLSQAQSSPDKKEKARPAFSKGNNDSLLADREYISASKKMKDGKYNIALSDFKRVSRKYPDAPQIWWDIALVHVQLEDFKNADKAIKKMLALEPDNQDANSLSGYIHYRLENYEEAASAYDQAGEPGGQGVTFFDAKTASERMKKSAGSK
ncbi:MAG: tetratricopeptide repeat protein [Erysipelotrichia bacterium]|nr:tetratricopeptide repeat protein [Erysipelotrichia bacterium]